MAFLGSIWTSLSVGRRVLVFFWEEESPSMVQLTTFARTRVIFFSFRLVFRAVVRPFGLRPLWGMVKGNLGWGLPCRLG